MARVAGGRVCAFGRRIQHTNTTAQSKAVICLPCKLCEDAFCLLCWRPARGLHAWALGDRSADAVLFAGLGYVAVIRKRVFVVRQL